MKQKRSAEYRKIAMTAFLVVAASLLFYFMLFRASTIGAGLKKIISVMNPVFYGFIIAYVLDPVMSLIESGVYRLLNHFHLHPGEQVKKTIRLITALMAVVIAILVIYALIAMITPQLIKSIRNIIRNIPVYQTNINNFIDRFSTGSSADEKTTAVINNLMGRLQKWVNSDVMPQMDNIATLLTDRVFNFITFLKNIFLGVIVSVYVLASKEVLTARFRRLVYAIFPIPTGNRILHNLRFMDDKFGGFIIGKVIDSVIIGILCYVITSLLKFPYTMLIAVFVGITNIVPFFGPFIGAIPSTVLIFVVNPIQALYFILFILILQQFDGNILGPKILGNSVGVSSFMVVVAILVGSGFFGVGGMVIGVPVCAVLTALVQTYVLRRMHKKGLPGDLESYHYLDHIDPESSAIIDEDPDRQNKSLYNAIKYRNPVVRSFDEPLKEHSWDRTMEDVYEEDALISGIRKDKNGGKPKEEVPADEVRADTKAPDKDDSLRS